MAIDHSLTYRTRSLRNLVHQHRLRTIERLLASLCTRRVERYIDFGCSNGYVTDRVRQLLGPTEAVGVDHLAEHVAQGRAQYPTITFRQASLNVPHADLPRADVVTCFEVLEHVGNLRQAVTTIVESVAPGGFALLSVPIEHGWKGMLKYIAKRRVYGYRLAELPGGEAVAADYWRALSRGGRIGGFRAEAREGWSTHFGFDTRDLDDVLRSLAVSVRSVERGTTRFYIVQP
jgi:2-polyprenyl-3-methyl-5-hydroxy-6-metoxy-1,4-benzoquinol methylase